MDRFVILSGCSGGGKSALLAELGRRGFGVIEEPGRRIVAEERAGSGAALPWVDLAAFARRAMAMALRDRERAADMPGLVFFDRGLIDAAVALEHATGEAALEACRAVRYCQHVFLTPPWREIYAGDAARRDDWTEAVAEYDRLSANFRSLGYSATVLPRIAVSERADVVLRHLSAAGLG